MGLGGEENAGEKIEGGVRIFRAANNNNGTRIGGSQREHVVVRRWWGAGGAKGADVD